MSNSPVASAAGYSPVTKWLHWVVFFLMVAQFLVGYAIEEFDDSDRVEDRLFVLHFTFGLTILVLATVRVWWRRARPLPPWAPTLSAFERRFAHWVERGLYLLMFAIPLSGLGLAIADERRLPVVGRLEIFEVFDDVDDFFEIAHIGSHLIFFAFFALHVGLVLKHQFVDRDALLSRML
jgi:cytochrome b561